MLKLRGWRFQLVEDERTVGVSLMMRMNGAGVSSLKMRLERTFQCVEYEAAEWRFSMWRMRVGFSMLKLRGWRFQC